MENIAAFLAESNRIEGYEYSVDDYLEALEGTPTGHVHVDNSVDAFRAVELFMLDPMAEERVLILHRIQMQGLLPYNEAGYYRRVQVYVGNYVPPKAEIVPIMMQGWIQAFNDKINPAMYNHLAFEHIHPFIDGNGRVGRLLWAWDLLADNRPVQPILDYYVGDDFFQKRASYYERLDKFHGNK
jgi:Fic family protein